MVEVRSGRRTRYGTFALYEETSGPLVVDDVVFVKDVASGAVGGARVMGLDEDLRVVYLSLAWGTLDALAWSSKPWPQEA